MKTTTQPDNQLTAIMAQGEVIHGTRTPGTLYHNGNTVEFVAADGNRTTVFDVALSDILRIEKSPYGFTIVTATNRYYLITIPLVDALNGSVSPYFFGIRWARYRQSGTKQWVARLASQGVKLSPRGQIRFYTRFISIYLAVAAIVVALAFWIFG